MKKLKVLIAAGGVIVLAGCGKIMQHPEPTATQAPTETPVPTETFAPTATLAPTATFAPTATLMPTEIPKEEQSGTLEALRTEMQVGGNLCAVAYLGYEPDRDFSDMMDFLDYNGTFARYPFLEELTEGCTVLASGGEWYVVVPADEGITITVSECVLDETTYTLVAGRELLQVGGGKLVLLQGNVSDIYPSFFVTVTDKNGGSITCTPSLSLRDGRLNQEEGVYDFTEYKESYE